jgi:tetratricopeptide (TPR) repeat protein
MPLDARSLGRLVHREMVQLAIVAGFAAAAFLLIRQVAAAAHRQAAQDAAAWFARGQTEMARGRLAPAAEAFRHAAVRRRDDRTYGLALARALAARGQPDAAWRELLALRGTAPDDPDINLALARVAVARGDLPGARRFYDNALYAPWPATRVAERYRVRLELIQFLMAHGDGARALAELVAVSATAPDAPADQNAIARLFATAGDDRRALSHFRLALAREPRNQAALAGAGLAAFALQDYRQALKYLRLVTGGDMEVQKAAELATLVLSSDPLAPRLGAVERRRRLYAAITRAQQRLDGCPMTNAVSSPPELARRTELEALAASTKRAKTLDQDSIETALDAVADAGAYTAAHGCALEPADRALGLIQRLHRDGGR